MITEDKFFNGKLTVNQYKNGYRYSVDSILLSEYIKPHNGDKIIELGTGCAVISLILGFKNKNINIFAVEIQKELYELAESNIKKNNMQDIIKIFNEDLKKVKQDLFSGPVDIVFANPPYRKLGSGKLNRESQKAKARHEIEADIKDVAAAAKRLLKTGGKFYAVYPAERSADIIHVMKNFDIEPKELQVIHSRINEEAKLILIMGIKKGNPGLKIPPPMFINS